MRKYLLFLLALPVSLAASSFAPGSSGNWGCGFYPNGVNGYAAQEDIQLDGFDASGNPVDGTFLVGNPHFGPQCTPGIQTLNMNIQHGPVPAPGTFSWTYLGNTYSSTPFSTTESGCLFPGCFATVSVTPSLITASFGAEINGQEVSFDLSGTPYVSTESFGQSPAYVGSTYVGTYYYSDGTFTFAPEPGYSAGLGLLLLAAAGGMRRALRKGR